jgi:hypothetical protein
MIYQKIQRGAAFPEVKRAKRGVVDTVRMLIEPGSYWICHQNQVYKFSFQLCSQR